MKLADILANVPDAAHHDAIAAAWKGVNDTAYEAGKSSVSYDARQATDSATKLRAEVDKLKGEANDGATLAARLKELEAQHATWEPIVTQHQTGALRTAVTAAAGLRDDMMADALIARMDIAMGDDGKLTGDAVKSLGKWAKDPANAARVKGADADAPPPQPGFRVQASPIAGQPDAKIMADLSRLPPAAQEAAKVRLRAAGLI